MSSSSALLPSPTSSNSTSHSDSPALSRVGVQQQHQHPPQQQQQKLQPQQTLPHRTTTTSSSNHRRTFMIGSRFRFQCSRQRILDAILDCTNYALESLVYFIGPLLIALALSIVGLLVYTFFYIVYPMMEKKYTVHPYKFFILAGHIACVIFFLVNVLFNYASCVLQQHKGPHYDTVVREIAAATDFVYPDSSNDLVVYRRDFHDRMVLRMRRRQARAQEAANMANTIDAAGPTTAAIASGMTKRKGSTATATTTTQTSAAPPAPLPKVRDWMLMGPFEWGFCGNSNQPKPPRSHYDHVTKCLVLNLDHYCPWMFNSVGYFNYRYFLNFMIYVFCSMIYGAVLMLEPFLLSKSPEYRRQATLQRQASKHGKVMERLQPMLVFREEKMLLTLSFMLCAAVGIALLILGGFHIYLTLTSQTTIEFHANWAARRRARKTGAKWKNPYSQGTCRANWQQVYGSQSLWTALLPSRREPEFLPFPIPGQPSRRASHRKATEYAKVTGGGSDDASLHSVGLEDGNNDMV